MRDDAAVWSFSAGFVPLVLFILCMTGIGLFIFYWSKRNDKKIRRQVRESLTRRNPFDAATNPAPVEPGAAWNRMSETRI